MNKSTEEPTLDTIKKVVLRYNITKIGDNFLYEAEDGKHYVLTPEVLTEMINKQLSDDDYVRRNYF